MFSATILAIAEVVGIFFFGVSISWLLFKILQTKLQHTPPPYQERRDKPSHTDELRLAVEQTRLDVERTKLRTEEMRLMALQTRADVVRGGGKRGRGDDTLDTP